MTMNKFIFNLYELNFEVALVKFQLTRHLLYYYNHYFSNHKIVSGLADCSFKHIS